MMCAVLSWIYGGPTAIYDMPPWALEYALRYCV